jgi:Kef-type K+ transport system membrane component KefB
MLALAPPLGAHPLLVFLLQIAVLLLLALCLGRLAARLGMPAVVGELLAGVLIGPSLLGGLAPGLTGWLLPSRPDQAHLLDAVGQLGVLLLVGVTGAQLDTGLLRRRRATAARISLGGLVVPLALGVALGYALPMSLIGSGTERPVFAAFLGVAMCVSAIPVIAKTLTDMNLLHRDVGQLTLAAGAVDDAVGWFLLSVVSAMAAAGVHAGSLTFSVLALVGFVLFAVLIGRPLVRLVLRVAARSDDPGPTVAITVVVILLGAAATHALGMEPVFGAFVAGILCGSAGPAARGRSAGPAGSGGRPDRDAAGGSDLSPGRRLAALRLVVLWVLAPIFLASAGLRLDLGALTRPPVLLGGIVVLLVAVIGKFTGAYLGARASRLSRWEGLALGAAMNARGVIEIVVATVGLRLGVLTSATYTIVVLVAVVTSLMAPPLLRWAMARVEHNADERLRATGLAEWQVPTR